MEYLLNIYKNITFKFRSTSKLLFAKTISYIDLICSCTTLTHLPHPPSDGLICFIRVARLIPSSHVPSRSTSPSDELISFVHVARLNPHLMYHPDPSPHLID